MCKTRTESCGLRLCVALCSQFEVPLRPYKRVFKEITRYNCGTQTGNLSDTYMIVYYWVYKSERVELRRECRVRSEEGTGAYELISRITDQQAGRGHAGINVQVKNLGSDVKRYD